MNFEKSSERQEQMLMRADWHLEYHLIEGMYSKIVQKQTFICGMTENWDDGELARLDANSVFLDT